MCSDSGLDAGFANAATLTYIALTGINQLSNSLCNAKTSTWKENPTNLNKNSNLTKHSFRRLRFRIVLCQCVKGIVN